MAILIKKGGPRIGRIFTPNQRRKLEMGLKRAQGIEYFGRGPDGEPLAEYMAGELKHALDFDRDPSPEQLKAIGKLIKDAHRGDEGAAAELMRLRIMSTMNYIMPQLHFGMFYEVVTLADDERPAVQNETKAQELTVRKVSQDGPGKYQVRMEPVVSETLIDLFDIATDEVEYPSRDIYLGDIGEVTERGLNLDFDLQNKIDNLLFTALDASVGNFTLTGNKAARVYLANSRIVDNVIPTTNALAIAGVGGSTKFGPDSLDLILDYAASWAGTTKDGELAPTGELIINPKDIAEFRTGITMTNAAQNQLAQQVLAMGWFELPAYHGINWRCIPDVTIQRKKLYARFNKPAGTYWQKPSRSKDMEKVDEMLDKVTRWKRQCMGISIINNQRPNVARVQFRS